MKELRFYQKLSVLKITIKFLIEKVLQRNLNINWIFKMKIITKIWALPLNKLPSC